MIWASEIKQKFDDLSLVRSKKDDLSNSVLRFMCLMI